jgi:hypothetical protein
MKKALIFAGLIALLVFTIAGCDLLGINDRIVGNWQLVSVNDVAPLLVTVAAFTDSAYTVTTATVPTFDGTWTKSSGTYTLTGNFFWFASSGSFTPTFSNSSDTVTYTDGSSDTYVWNRQ